MIHQKQELTTSNVRDTEETFVVSLRGQNIENYFFYTQLPLNEDDNHFEQQLNYINYKKTVKKLHDAGWKKSYFTSDDVSMLGYGCGVSQYPQFYVEYLDMYQMLPRPYLRSFDSGPGDNLVLKMGVRLVKSIRNICLGMY